jgi:hypothetical protein
MFGMAFQAATLPRELRGSARSTSRKRCTTASAAHRMGGGVAAMADVAYPLTDHGIWMVRPLPIAALSNLLHAGLVGAF